MEHFPFSSAEIQRQLDRILNSRAFQKSERMSRFLRFTVEQVLAGQAGQLKEYLLGVEVFDRKQSYDPRVDPIVRVEARRLRTKLAKYYESDGCADSIRFTFPTGSYTPQFLSNLRQPDPPPPSPEPGKKIAVLPFTNMSEQAGNEYFSDGLTTELIHALTKLDGLQVVAWNSAAQWKGRPYDVKEISGLLDANVVLEGSVRHSGEQVRITVQMIDARTGVYLWSERYDREMRDIFAIQQEIAQSVAAVLKMRFQPGPARAVRREPDLVAYHLYLMGRHEWNKRSEGALRTSVGHFEAAIARDPNCAVAYAGLADAWGLLGEFGIVASGEAMPKAKAAALRALELDPTLAEAHTSLGFIRGLFDWEWREAGEHYQKAIQLNPGYATAHHWYSLDYLALNGRLEEAQPHIELARQLDPLSTIIAQSEGYLMMLNRRYADALCHYEKVIQSNPSFHRLHAAMGRIYGLLGRYDEAIAAFMRSRELCGDLPSLSAALGQNYALAGRREDALRELARLDNAGYGQVSFTQPAMIHLGLGEYGRALDLLEMSFERRDLPLTVIAVHPAYDAVRHLPRFQSILERMNFQPAPSEA